MKIIALCLVMGSLVAAWGSPSSAASPEVTNVALNQRQDGSGLVDISYDVADADGDPLMISVRASLDGGATWDFPVINTAGDIGAGVMSGVDRSIVWNLGIVPQKFSGSDFMVKVIASDVGVDFPANSPGQTAIMDFSAIDWSNPANIEKYSRAGLCQIMAANVWQGGDNGHIDVVGQMRALNPDIKVIGYVSAKSAQLSGESPSADLFWHEWFLRTRPYWAYTTTGDTVQDWPNTVVINILNPDCRTAMVETIVEFQRNSLNQLDGIFWDYFNPSLWIPNVVSVEGEPDLDGDGIGHFNDPDERAAYRSAEVALVQAVRDSLGEGFIQIFNGQRAYSDTTFASLADGLIYELFPTLYFPDPDMAHALDPNFANSLTNIRNVLRADNGGPFIVLTNPWRNFYNDQNMQPTRVETGNQFRAVALLVDAYACWSTDGTSSFNYIYGWPQVPVSLGAPLGEATYESNFIRRDFAYGRVEIEMKSGFYPNAFDYRIWELGQIVEELAIPYHFP